MSNQQSAIRSAILWISRVVIVMTVTASLGKLSAQDVGGGGQNLNPNANAAGGRYWTTRWEFEEIDIEKLAERLAAIGVDLGLELRGTVTVKFDVGIPLTSLRDGAAYRFDGTLTSPRLVVDSVDLKDFETSVTYRNGLAKLTQLHTSIVGAAPNAVGKIAGSGSLQLVPRGDVTAELNIEKIAIAPISKLLAKFLPSKRELLPDAGRLSGEIQFRAPIDNLSDIQKYKLEGRVNGQNLKLASLAPADFTIDNLVIEDGRMQLSNLDLSTTSPNRGQPSIRLIGKADVPLSGAGAFSFELAGDDLPLSDLAGLATQSERTTATAIVDGKLDFRLQGSGELDAVAGNSTWRIEGSIASPSMKLAGVDLGVLEHTIQFTPSRFDVLPRRDETRLPASFKLVKIQSQYRIIREALTFDSLTATIFGGQVSGTATVPRDGDGDFIANLTIADMRPTVRIPASGKLAPTLSATLAGDIDWRVPISKLSDPNEHRGTGTVSASDIMMGNERVGELVAQIVANQGQLSLHAGGELFGGKVDVKTVAVMQANDGWSDVMTRLGKSQFRFDSVPIDPLVDLSVGRSVGLTGTGSGVVDVDFQSQTTGRVVMPDARVSLALSRVKYRERLLSRQMSLEGRIENGVFVIQPLQGDYASGSLRLDGRVHLLDGENAFHPRADLRVVASRIQLEQGLWFLGNAAQRIQGRFSSKATITGYQESIRVRGNVSGRELAVYELPIGAAHSGLIGNANLRSLSWNLKFPSVRSVVGGGQLEGELALASGRGGGLDLSSRWKTQRVDFFRLTNQLGRSSSLARGEISGELSLRGKSIRSLNDLAGRFDFRLGQTRGAAIPGLTAASQFLGPVSLTGQTFDVGEAKGIISQGAVVIDEFWLASDSALVQADGKIFLTSGRMNLTALIATGDYRDIAANFAQLAQQYALRSLLPASAILSVSELLRDRTLVVAVLGTTQNPIVRLRPIETFREEAARFLLREGQRLILAGTAAGAVNGLDGGF